MNSVPQKNPGGRRPVARGGGGAPRASAPPENPASSRWRAPLERHPPGPPRGRGAGGAAGAAGAASRFYVSGSMGVGGVSFGVGSGEAPEAAACSSAACSSAAPAPAPAVEITVAAGGQTAIPGAPDSGALIVAVEAAGPNPGAAFFFAVRSAPDVAGRVHRIVAEGAAVDVTWPAGEALTISAPAGPVEAPDGMSYRVGLTRPCGEGPA